LANEHGTGSGRRRAEHACDAIPAHDSAGASASAFEVLINVSEARAAVGIVGAGPAGPLLGPLLDRTGIESVTVAIRTEGHVIDRVRAGVLEQTTVDLHVLDRISAFHRDLGERWRPAPLLTDLAARGQTFRQWDRVGRST
jgi:hypothetical protein